MSVNRLGYEELEALLLDSDNPEYEEIQEATNESDALCILEDFLTRQGVTASDSDVVKLLKNVRQLDW